MEDVRGGTQRRREEADEGTAPHRRAWTRRRRRRCRQSGGWHGQPESYKPKAQRPQPPTLDAPDVCVAGDVCHLHHIMVAGAADLRAGAGGRRSAASCAGRGRRHQQLQVPRPAIREPCDHAKATLSIGGRDGGWGGSPGPLARPSRPCWTRRSPPVQFPLLRPHIVPTLPHFEPTDL